MAAKEKAPNLASVAASAGVSVATVSKVVNGRADVGAETRARIQNLLDERQRFCFFFGQTFDIAFADVLATYNDVVTGCEMLHLYRGSLQQNDVEALGPHKRLVPIVFKHEDPAQDVTRFRLLRAMALVDSVYAPVVAERERRKARAAARDAMDAVTAH